MLRRGKGARSATSRVLCPWLLAAAVTACAPHSAPITANALTTAGQVGAPRPTSVANTAAATAATSAPAVAPDSAWWSTDDVRVPRYAGVVRASRHIAMDDGVRLAIDVYLPRNLEPGTRLPTILEQTRYRRSLEPRPELRDSLDRPGSRTAAFVTRGYAYVVVDVRGSGASFGSRNIELGPIEVGDGNEVVDWIIRQPWSNGAVGATGISYVGSTAELLLVNRHPAVRAIVPQFTSAPLAQDMEVTGHPIVTLFVNSTASDGAFFVYLEEVDESGHVRYVTEGALRAIHRKRSDDPPAYATIIPHRTYRRGDAMPLVPGQIAELTFDLLPTSYLFREGRRIRVAIAGADIDHFPAIPAIPPTVHVLRDREHPSRIHLPVIP